MGYVRNSSLRLDRGQQLVTLTTISYATPTKAVALQTEVEVSTVQTSVPNSIQSNQEQGLSTGWIVAIVALVLLAISLTYIAIQLLGNKRKSRSSRGNRRSVYDRSSSYYEISKPAQTRSRSRSRRR